MIIQYRFPWAHIALFIGTLLPALLALRQASAQPPATPQETWNALLNIQYQPNPLGIGDYGDPIFPANVKALEGTRITLSGFIIPFDGLFEPQHLIISSLPIDACFFCGTGGPESVAEVYLKDAVDYTPKAVLITGTLELNSEDPAQLIYILRNAELLGPITK